MSIIINTTPLELDQIQSKCCKGHFEGFPPEIVLRLSGYLQTQLCTNQVDYNKLPERIFNGYIDLRKTPEGSEFWKEVILHKDFARYFNRYPPVYYTGYADFLRRYHIITNNNIWFKGVSFLCEKEPSTTLSEESLYENIKLKKDVKRIY